MRLLKSLVSVSLIPKKRGNDDRRVRNLQRKTPTTMSSQDARTEKDSVGADGYDVCSFREESEPLPSTQLLTSPRVAPTDEHDESAFSRDEDNDAEKEDSHADLHDFAAPFIADDVPKPGPNVEDLESILQNARFGFAQVDVEVNRAARKRSSLVVISALAQEMASVQISTQHESAQRRQELRAQRIQRIKSALRVLLTVAALVDAVYVLMSVPLRIGFLFDPLSDVLERGEWTSDLTTFSILDIAGEIIRFAYMYTERKTIVASFSKHSLSQISAKSAKSIGRPRVHVVTPQLASLQTAKTKPLPSISLFSTREGDRVEPAVSTAEVASVDRSSGQRKRMPYVVLIFLLLPLDIITAATLNYNWIHLARAVKLVAAGYSLPLLYASLMRTFRQFQFVRMLSFSTLSLPFYIFWLGLYLCHVSACGYMLIAHFECGLAFTECSTSPVPGCWVLKDRLDQGSFRRQYIRTMYWASKTITTLGQGDLVPATQIETNYCVIVQYMSGLWATSFLSACSFYFSRRDADMDESASTRLEQALMVGTIRLMPLLPGFVPHTY